MLSHSNGLININVDGLAGRSEKGGIIFFELPECPLYSPLTAKNILPRQNGKKAAKKRQNILPRQKSGKILATSVGALYVNSVLRSLDHNLRLKNTLSFIDVYYKFT